MNNIKKIQKKLGKLCVITWWDAVRIDSKDEIELPKLELETNYISGWIKDVNKKRIVVSFLHSKNNSFNDVLLIPTGWIQKIEYLE